MSALLFGYATSILAHPTTSIRQGLSRGDRSPAEVTSKSPAELLEEFETNFERKRFPVRLLQIGLAACPTAILFGLFLLP